MKRRMTGAIARAAASSSSTAMSLSSACARAAPHHVSPLRRAKDARARLAPRQGVLRPMALTARTRHCCMLQHGRCHVGRLVSTCKTRCALYLWHTLMIP
jgi:hypothetical protein